jgi:hypothetical protein
MLWTTPIWYLDPKGYYCKMTSVGIAFEKGDEVILGEHEDNPTYGKNWSLEMKKYVGKKAKITGKIGTSDIYTYYYVDADQGKWCWRGENMTLVESVTEAIKAPEVYGAKCIKCSEYNNYVLASDNFMCYSCKH